MNRIDNFFQLIVKARIDGLPFLFENVVSAGIPLIIENLFDYIFKNVKIVSYFCLQGSNKRVILILALSDVDDELLGLQDFQDDISLETGLHDLAQILVVEKPIIELIVNR